VDYKTVDANNSLCTCGSGKPIINCCVTARANTTPPLPKTGFANPECYARQLQDCDKKIAGEHFISETVLKTIIIPGKQLFIMGPSWLKNEIKRNVSSNSIKAKVLCERHNNALGDLDNLGKKYFEYIMNINVNSEIMMINGDDIERWMLKALCGYLASGWSPNINKLWQPTIQWLNILFGSEELPSGSGFYILKGQDIVSDYHQLAMNALESDQNNEFNGIFFSIAGFQFMFFMGEPSKEISSRTVKAGLKMVYKPECLVIIDEIKQREIHFGLPPRSEYVVIKVNKITK
jgi:hypothetical protein